MRTLARACLAALVAAAAFGVPGSAVGTPAGPRPVVGPGVLREIATHGSARVVVAFRAPRALRTLSSTEAAVRPIRTRVLAHAGRGFQATARWDSVFGVPGNVDAAGLRRLRIDPEVRRIDLDVGGRVFDAESDALIHAGESRSQGFTGAGVTVAVVDSGVQASHPDLADSIVAEHCWYENGCPNGSSEQAGPGSARDDNGHGTNVTGIITANGTIAPIGIAPAAKIVAIRVTNSRGEFRDTGQIVTALQWILNNPQLGVRVINMSLGTATLFSGTCDNANAYAMSFASVVHSLRLAGVTVFAASGNEKSLDKMSLPACLGEVVSVGAVYDSAFGAIRYSDCEDDVTAADKVTCFSNSGPALDLLAPGGLSTSTGRNDGISTMAGTSQASPAAAAAAADVLQANPLLTPSTLEGALKSTGKPVTDSRGGRTTPRIDVLAGVNLVKDGTIPPPAPPPPPPPPAPPPPPPPASPPPPPAPAPQCVVPQVVGKKFSDAIRLIGRANCGLGKMSNAWSKKKRGTVVRQSPRAGLRRANGARVALVVSRGPKPSARPVARPRTSPAPAAAAPRCVVPRLVGRSFTQAIRAIFKANCGLGRISHAYSSKHRWNVIRQSPRAGVRRANGARIAVVVSRGEKRR